MRCKIWGEGVLREFNLRDYINSWYQIGCFSFGASLSTVKCLYKILQIKDSRCACFLAFSRLRRGVFLLRRRRARISQ